MSIDGVMGHFSLWGNLDANAVTGRLGLSPSEVYLKGETTLSDQPALVTTWDLHCAEGLTAEEQIESLLTLLWPHAEDLRKLTERFQGAFNIVGDADLCLEPATMEKLAQLNLTLNFFNHKNATDFDDEAVSA